MSDVPEGPGWWQASDGQWYPPESFTDAQGGAVPDPAAATSGWPPAEPISPMPNPYQPPPPPQVINQAGAFLLTIGDIGITADTVVTPNGSAPLAGSQWILTDRTQTQEAIPTWAIVMAIIFALACLLGLLFLLVKETRTTGYAEVSVSSGGLTHMTQLPVNGPNALAQYRWMVGQAQSLAASASYQAGQ